MTTTPAPLLEVCNVSKGFPGVQALDGVSLTLQRGEVLAVLGENGAGKSTLMKILAGIYRPDTGEVRLDGREVRFEGVSQALEHGISLIHQELNLAENLSISANLFLGREPRWGGPLGFLRGGKARRLARDLMARVGLPGSPDTLVGSLSPGQRQLVEIARALSLQVRILIMDEPTSSLTQREADRLFEVVADLKTSGVSVVYISHRLGEVKQVADRVTVLRDGKNAGDLTQSEITHDAMVRLMVGRELAQFFQRQHRAPNEEMREEVYEVDLGPALTRSKRAKPAPTPRFEVRGLRYVGARHGATFRIAKGEIVGMAGLVGAGRTELAEALFGVRRIVEGEVRIDGQPVKITTPEQAVHAGLLLVPEDRRFHGLVLEESIQHNVGLPNFDTLSLARLLLPWRERALARTMSERLRIRTPGLRQTVGLLSGGNQQKVVLAKWLARQPRVLIFDEPTRGIDVGAKSEIYALMDELAGQGVAILMISSDMEEILGMSDRVLVLHEGRLAGQLSRRDLSEEAVMRLATGGGR